MSNEVTMQTDFSSKLTGHTRYVGDIHLPGELYGGIVRSPHPHARIVKIDTTRAKEIPGVKVVLTANDVPNHVYGPTQFKDWNIFARERVLFIGDEVAAVAASSEASLKKALDAIVVEYEVLTPIFHPKDAMAPDAPILHEETANNRPMHVKVERGDIDDAFAHAHIVRGGRYTTNRIYQGHLEPIGVLANWSQDEGLTIWAPSHIPYRARETYAAAFGLPEDKVRIIVPPIGGSFGSKYVLKAHVIAAALSMAVKQPIRMIFDRYEDMLTAHPRVPLTIDIRIAADEDGKFLAKDVTVYGDAGARIYWSPNVMATACTRPDSLYHFQNVRAQGYLCYTNHSPTTCMRGFGNAEMLFAVESVIDEIAKELNMDPVEIRIRNIVHRDEVTIHGYQLDSCELEACLKKAAEISNWARRKDLPKYRGIGVALGNHVSGYRGIDNRFEGSTSVVRLNANGQVEVETGEIDLGQGMSTTYATIAARVLGINPNLIVVKSGDTTRFPFGIGTLASRSTVMGGNAVKLAAEQFRDQIITFVQSEYGPTAVFENGVISADAEEYGLSDVVSAYRSRYAGDVLEVRASYRPDTDFPGKDFYGNPSPAYPFAAHVAEVEVDPETGRVKVIGYWAVHDAGVVINPTTAIGQVVGGVAQGIGWATMEDMIVDAGQVKSLSLLDYRMPGASDIPKVDVAFIEVPDPHGPFGAKSVGEVAIDPAPAAVANAIAHAIGVRGHDLPLSPERVWRLMNGKEEHS